MDGKRLTIGFAGIADFQNVRGQKLVSGVLRAVEDFDVNLISFTGAIKYSLHDDLDFISHYGKNYRYFHRSNLDGLVAWASSFDEFLSENEILDLHRPLTGLPMVSLGTIRIPGVPGVLTRSEDGVIVLMDHLVKHHAYHSIGFVGTLSKSHFRVRYNTYRWYLEEAGLRCDPDAVHLLPHADRKEVAQAVDAMIRRFGLKNRQGLEALITITDSTASLLIEELQARGIRVPDDVAVVGYNNDLLSINTPVPITTVDLCFYEKGYESVRLLLKRIAEPQNPDLREHLFLPTALVVRQSCGCFEDEILRAGLGPVDSCSEASSQNLEEELLKRLQPYARDLRPDQVSRLASAVAQDFRGITSGSSLNLIRDFFRESMDHSTERNRIWQQILSEIRRLLLCHTEAGGEARSRLENLINQARVLVSVFNSYVVFSKGSDAYKFHALARIAIDFAQALDGRQIIETIKQHLDELEMPGIYLVLQDSLTPDLGAGHLALAYPYVESIDLNDRSVTILPGRLPPATFLPLDRRFSLMMEILYYQGSFLGYALIEIGPPTVSLYDTVRILLSHSLYAAFQRERRAAGQERQTLVRRHVLGSILDTSAEPAEPLTGFGAPTILTYLMEHLHEPTNLDTVARDLNISKSHLIRKTKALTGHTVQDLHELLKIERAKTLLDQRTMKVSVVSQRLGYSNQNYFSLVFKKVTGMSPRQWMQRNLRKPEHFL